MTTDERPPAERLLAAAEELFGERSYGRTTVADICARAGMATGSFYAYFDSKAEIFAAVVRTINRDLRRAMAMAVEKADDNQRARERACFRAFFDMVSRRPWIDRIVRESEFVAPGLFREYYEQLARGYARGVRVAQLAGEVDARYDPEVIAYVYTGIGNFVGMRWADWTAGGRVPDDVLDDVLELFARGLAPVKSTSTPLALTDRCSAFDLRYLRASRWNRGPFDHNEFDLAFLVVARQSPRRLLQGRAHRDDRRAVAGRPAGGGEHGASGAAGEVDQADRRVRAALPHQPRHQRDRVP
jgi:AcrR family transcriptional regulator